MPQPNDFTEGLDVYLSVFYYTSYLTFEQHVLLMSLIKFCLQLIMLRCKLLRTCSWRHVGRPPVCSDSLCVCPATACQLSVC